MLIKQWLLSAHADHEDDDTTEGIDDLASQLEELCSHYAAEYGLRIYYEDLGETPTAGPGRSAPPEAATPSTPSNRSTCASLRLDTTHPKWEGDTI